MRKSENEIKEILLFNNLELIDYEYSNNQHIVKYKCSCGKYEIVNFAHFLNRINKMCLKCSNEIRFSKQRKYTIENIKPLFEKRKWILLSDKFISVDSNLDCICDKGHRVSTSLYRFLNGCGCRECFIENNRRENHWNWRGGITYLKIYLREQLCDWKLKSFEEYSFKCFISETNYNLNIHHASKNFSSIVYETLELLNLELHSKIGDYSNEDLNNIIKLFLKLHDKYGYGVPIECDLHELFHRLYGKTNNTYEQLLEFKKDYQLGEFDELRKIG